MKRQVLKVFIITGTLSPNKIIMTVRKIWIFYSQKYTIYLDLYFKIEYLWMWWLVFILDSSIYMKHFTSRETLACYQTHKANLNAFFYNETFKKYKDLTFSLWSAVRCGKCCWNVCWISNVCNYSFHIISLYIIAGLLQF